MNISKICRLPGRSPSLSVCLRRFRSWLGRFPFATKIYDSVAAIILVVCKKMKKLVIFTRIVSSKVPCLKPDENRRQYIVSLTSYGSRVKSSAPYAIYSLFRQDVLPDKIILWLDNKNWSNNNIPFLLRKLKRFGLEIRFCEDVKSFTKLLFTLEAFPNDSIITADDDLYYPNNWLGKLLFEHKKNPNKIICHRVHGIKVDENHNPLPYHLWDYEIDPNIYFSHIFMSQEKSIPRHQLESIFPTGAGGILYPPKCFHKDVAKKELFLKLSPKQDDIWFWAMAVINTEYFNGESPYIVIKNGYAKYLQQVDQQQRHGNVLWGFNWFQGGNDKQLKAVIGEYPQIKDILSKIQP